MIPNTLPSQNTVIPYGTMHWLMCRMTVGYFHHFQVSFSDLNSETANSVCGQKSYYHQLPFVHALSIPYLGYFIYITGDKCNESLRLMKHDHTASFLSSGMLMMVI